MIKLSVGSKFEINGIVVEVVTPQGAFSEKFLLLYPKGWQNVCVFLSENHIKDVVREIASNPSARHDGATVKATNNLNQICHLSISDFEKIVRWVSNTVIQEEPQSFRLALNANKIYN